MYYKAVFDLFRPLEAKIPEEKEILNKMSNDPLFATPPVAYVDFDTALQNQDTALAEAQFGGIERTATKNANAAIVDDMVRQLRSYVSMVANGDTQVILASGFRHTKTRTSAGDMPQVEDLKQMVTGVSQQLKLKWKPVENSSYYEVAIQPQDPKAGEGAEPAEKAYVPHTTQVSSITIDGLQSLTYYHVKVRASGTKGFGPYSEVTIMLVT